MSPPQPGDDPATRARRSRWVMFAGVTAAIVVMAALVPERSSGPRGSGWFAAHRWTAIAEGARPSSASSSTAPTFSSAPSLRAPVASARGAAATLATLAVRGRAPRTGYSRDAFGQAWADVDRNGCDTRNDMLRRDLAEPRGRGCVVLSGTLRDPYSGTVVAFTRGDGQVEIDHVVALSNAWQTGAQQWPARKRLAFANDPLNLLAVTRGANQAKSDGDAATWLPPNRGYWCALVARQVAVKAKYQLWVTAAERDAVTRVLARCPGERVPTGAMPTLAPFDAPVVRRAPSASPSPPARGNCEPSYPDVCIAPGPPDLDCGDVPYNDFRVVGDDPHGFDGDDDGVGCES